MIVLGLTGSIGMGKSTAAGMLRRMGIAVFDADAVVHDLLAPHGRAVAAVESAFPGVRGPSGAIERPRLAQRVFGDPSALRRLERIIHPLVHEAERRFIGRAAAQRLPLVVLDIPLLFESGAERRCDYVLVVSAPAWLQRERVMRRAAMSRERFAAILRQQMPDAEKRRRADFVVPTGLGRGITLRRLGGIVRVLRAGPKPARRQRGRRRCAKS